MSWRAVDASLLDHSFSRKRRKQTPRRRPALIGTSCNVNISDNSSDEENSGKTPVRLSSSKKKRRLPIAKRKFLDSFRDESENPTCCNKSYLGNDSVGSKLPLMMSNNREEKNTLSPIHSCLPRNSSRRSFSPFRKSLLSDFNHLNGSIIVSSSDEENLVNRSTKNDIDKTIEEFDSCGEGYETRIATPSSSSSQTTASLPIIEEIESSQANSELNRFVAEIQRDLTSTSTTKKKKIRRKKGGYVEMLHNALKKRHSNRRLSQSLMDFVPSTNEVQAVIKEVKRLFGTILLTLDVGAEKPVKVILSENFNAQQSLVEGARLRIVFNSNKYKIGSKIVYIGADVIKPLN